VTGWRFANTGAPRLATDPAPAQRRVTGDFTMVDFLTFAGVAPDQRGQ
jgi:hypothetical protein